MDFQIRPYSDNDLQELLLSWENASRLAHPFLSDSFLQQEKYNIPNSYLPNADTWVLVENEYVVGFIALIGNEVGAIFVEPLHHGRGFGKALMDKARNIHNTLEVDVFRENGIGRRFYDRYGFVLQSEKNHEASGQPILRMIYTTPKNL